MAEFVAAVAVWVKRGRFMNEIQISGNNGKPSRGMRRGQSPRG